jgi:hypothetical protein
MKVYAGPAEGAAGIAHERNGLPPGDLCSGRNIVYAVVRIYSIVASMVDNDVIALRIF